MSDSDVYTAEKILAKRVRVGVTQYLIKWMNFPKRDSTWEPVENVLDPSLLETFHQEKRNSKRKNKKTRKSKLDSPRPSQSRDRSRSPARNTPNSLSPEPSKLVLDESVDESVDESDQTVQDYLPAPVEQSVSNRTPEPEEIIPILTKHTTVATPPPKLTPTKQPVHDVRSSTPTRPASRQSPIPKPSINNLAPKIDQASPIAQRPTTADEIQAHQQPVVQQPAMIKSSLVPTQPVSRQSPVPQVMMTRQSPAPSNSLSQPIAKSQTPPKSPAKPTVQTTPKILVTPKIPAASRSQATPMIQTTPAAQIKPIGQTAPMRQTAPKIQEPIQKPIITNNHRFPSSPQSRPVAPKSRKFAVMNTWITDVYTDRADYTVTLSESPRDHGFFRESSKNGVDATTQF